jgi:Sec-independent protein translocase protein TatA
MAQKGGFKRFLLVLVFLALAVVVFILFGGGKFLKETGNWLGGVGKKAEEVKQDMEKKASTVEKVGKETVEKLKSGDKK